MGLVNTIKTHVDPIHFTLLIQNSCDSDATLERSEGSRVNDMLHIIMILKIQISVKKRSLSTRRWDSSLGLSIASRLL